MTADLIQSSCDSNLCSIRSSPLNYSVQETAFSLYVTVRKSTRKNFSSTQQNYILENISENKDELHLLQSRCQLVLNENEALKSQLEEAVVEVEEKENSVKSLRTKLNARAKELETAERKLKTIDESNLILKVQIEDMVNVIKDLENEKKTLRTALKSSKKEDKDEEHDSKKKYNGLEDTIRNLNKFKITK